MYVNFKKLYIKIFYYKEQQHYAVNIVIKILINKQNIKIKNNKLIFLSFNVIKKHFKQGVPELTYQNSTVNLMFKNAKNSNKHIYFEKSFLKDLASIRWVSLNTVLFNISEAM